MMANHAKVYDAAAEKLSEISIKRGAAGEHEAALFYNWMANVAQVIANCYQAESNTREIG